MNRCSICLLDLDETNLKVTTPCNHNFHLSCFIDLIFMSNSCDNCPVCRSELNIMEIKKKIINHSNYCRNCLTSYKVCSSCNSSYCKCFITNENCNDCKLKYQINLLEKNINRIDGILHQIT